MWRWIFGADTAEYIIIRIQIPVLLVATPITSRYPAKFHQFKPAAPYWSLVAQASNDVVLVNWTLRSFQMLNCETSNALKEVILELYIAIYFP